MCSEQHVSTRARYDDNLSAQKHYSGVAGVTCVCLGEPKHDGPVSIERVRVPDARAAIVCGYAAEAPHCCVSMSCLWRRQDRHLGASMHDQPVAHTVTIDDRLASWSLGASMQGRRAHVGTWVSGINDAQPDYHERAHAGQAVLTETLPKNH